MISTSQQQFIDSVFGVRDLADPSKLGQFDASAISTGIARVLAFPNASGTIALEGWVDDNFLALDGEGSDVVNGTFNLTTTGLGTFGSLTVGELTLTGFTGILKAVIGVVTSDAVHGDLADADWTTVSDHDLRYFTETELGSNANALGASLIGIEDAMALYAGTDVEAALEEVMDDITIVTHVADSVTMDVGTATGSVSDTHTISDENVYVVHETTGPPNPNFVVTFDFSGITAGHEPNLIELHWGYNGGSGHIIELQMYNYNTSTWDVINNTILTDNEGNFHFNSFNIIDGGGTIVDYTSGGAARVRLSHAANGNAAHDFLIDYLAIKDDHGIGSGITDHGSMSGLDDDDHIEYHNDARAGVWLAANHETTYTHADIALNTTHRGESSGNPHSVTPTELSLVIGTDVQAWDAGLDSLASLSYVAASFIKMTGANTFALRTVGETADDLEGTIDHNELANYEAVRHTLIAVTTDTTINLDNSMSTAEMQAIIDGVGRLISPGVILTFQFADGTYAITATLKFKGFFGGGSVTIQGNSSESKTKHTTQAVILDGTGFNGTVVEVFENGCTMRVDFVKIMPNTNAGGYRGIRFLACAFSWLRYSYIQGNNSANGYGCDISYGFGGCAENYVSNVKYGIACVTSTVYAVNNDDTGTLPLYGYYATNGATIGKRGIAPTGSTADELILYGSRIAFEGISVDAASTDLTSVIALCNQIRTALISNGICA